MKSRINHTRTRRLVSFALALIGSAFFLGLTASAKTITVTGTGDTIAVDGVVTLREAICAANTNAACGDAPKGDPGADIIQFTIPGGGVKTINLFGNLPAIMEPLTIDGYTQVGGTPNSLAVGDNAVLRIVLDGSGAGASAIGLEIKAASCLIRGLVITHFAEGIKISGPSGKTATIEGNLIGTTDPIGFGNGVRGIFIGASSGNTIGGSTPAKRNLISGNGSCPACVGYGGIVVDYLAGSATFNVIQGNYIGTDASGMTAIGNDTGGITMNHASACIVGGAAAGAGNVISGNNGDGLTSGNGVNNFVQGNLIGTNAAGTAALPNAKSGVFTYYESGEQIGGVNAGERNVISGNTAKGLYIESGSGYIVQGNYIGTDVSGANPVGNGQEGILLFATSNNQLGGTVKGAGNVIAFNQGTAVAISDGGLSTSGDAINGNSIYGNGQLGIDLGWNGVTLNDDGDSDSGPNHLQNFPVLYSAISSAGTTTLFGELHSEPNTQYRIEIFLSVSADASGYGEGQTMIDSKVVATDSMGMANFSALYPGLNINQFLTATATDPNGNTSEFSQAKQIQGPTPNMSINDVSGTEGPIATTKQMTLTVSLSGPSAQSVSVNYATTDGTATAPEDYTAGSGTLTIPAGSTTGQIQVTIMGDNKFEANESFSVNLSNPSGAVITKAQGIGAIQNDDAQPTLAISNSDEGEGDSGTTQFTLEVSVSNPSYQPVTVSYASAGGTATSGVDFQPVNGTLTFNPGDLHKTVAINVIGDTTIEPNETFFVNLSNPVNAAIAKAQGVATIMNDDNATLSISSATQAEGNNGTTNFVFNVTLSAACLTPVTLNYATLDGTATAGSDYQPASGTLTFAPGETSKQVAVLVNGDTTNEPDETFVVQLTNVIANSAIYDNTPGTGTIVNDDAPNGGTLQFSQPNYSVQEDLGALTITVTRTGDTSGAASVNYASSDGSATQHGDYEIALGTINFAPGDTSKTFQVLINEDNYVEGTEVFSLTLSNPIGASLGANSSAAVRINDDSPESLTNPIDDAQSFVWQQYHDFLNREPDPPGLAGWTNTLLNCAPGDINCDRIHVSASFFQSAEFQQRGYFLYRFYSVGLGRKPDYAEFAADMSRISGFLDANQLEAAKVQFITDFMARPAYLAKYNALNNAAFVQMEMQTAGVNLANSGALITSLDTQQATRAQVLRQIVESSEVYQKYYNQAFVVMQYFGYLRRDPDALYLDWITVLDQTGDPRGMVNGFMNSLEYRQRFGL